MYRNNFSNSSDPSSERLSKLMDLTVQSSQGNDGLLREIQEASDFIKANNPEKYKSLIKDGIITFSGLLEEYDDMTIILSKYKQQFNGCITEEQKED